MANKMRASIKEPEFNKIQEMAKLGLNNAQIAKITGWSAGGVSLWRKHPVWKEYCDFKKTIPGGRVKPNISVVSTGSSDIQVIHGKDVAGVLSELVAEIRLLRLAWERNPREEDKSNNQKKSWLPSFGKSA